MDQTYIIARLKEITIPELLNAHAGEPTDIYGCLPPDLIDKITNTWWEFIDAVKQIKK